MQVSVPFLNDTECLKKYPEVNSQIKVCSGEQGKTTCQVSYRFLYKNFFFIYIYIFKGDSGGPLVVQSIITFFIIVFLMNMNA